MEERSAPHFEMCKLCDYFLYMDEMHKNSFDPFTEVM